MSAIRSSKHSDCVMTLGSALMWLSVLGCALGAQATNAEFEAYQETCTRLRIPKDAGDWTVTDVQTWGKDKELPQVLMAQLQALEIDGDILLHVDIKDIQEDLGVKSGLIAKKVFLKITALREQNEGMGVEGLSFWQQRTLNRKAMDSMVLLFPYAPRAALSYFKYFPAHAQPAAPIGTFTWIFLPEAYIVINSQTIVGGLPGLIPLCLVGRLVMKLFSAGLVAWASLGALAMKNDNSNVCNSLFSGLWLFAIMSLAGVGLMYLVMFELCGYFGSCIFYLLYPIIPWFICDLMFYLGIYVLPLVSFYHSVTKSSKKDKNAKNV